MIIVTEVIQGDVRTQSLVSLLSIHPWKYRKAKNRNKHLFFAMNVSPRQTHSSFRRQVLPGRLKSHAVQTSSVTIDGG